MYLDVAEAPYGAVVALKDFLARFEEADWACEAVEELVREIDGRKRQLGRAECVLRGESVPAVLEGFGGDWTARHTLILTTPQGAKETAFLHVKSLLHHGWRGYRYYLVTANNDHLIGWTEEFKTQNAMAEVLERTGFLLLD